MTLRLIVWWQTRHPLAQLAMRWLAATLTLAAIGAAIYATGG